MPLPLVLIPLIATATATSTAATSTGAIVTVTVLGGTACAGGAWWWFSPQPGPTREHLALLEAQRAIITSRIEMANAAVERLCEDSRILGLAVEAATASTNACSEHIQQLAGRVTVTHQRLTSALKVASDCGHMLTDAMPELKDISRHVLLLGDAATHTICLLKDTLDSKAASLHSLAADIRVLNGVVDAQSRMIDHLKVVSDTQDATITELTTQVRELEGIAIRYSNNCQFFKKSALKALAHPSSPPPNSTTQPRGVSL